MKKIVNKQTFAQARGIAYRIGFLLVFLVIVVGFIAFARGYRITPQNDSMISSTGILTVGSGPKAAKIFVNGELKGVTDSNLTLPPDVYQIRVTKEGYTSWEKEVRLKGEIVQSLEAILFPKNPSLSPLTNLGIRKALPVGNSNRVLLFVDNDSVPSDTDTDISPSPLLTPEETSQEVSSSLEEDTDGIYLFEERNQPISILPPLNEVVLENQLPANVDLAKTEVIFSPDYKEAIFTFFPSLENEPLLPDELGTGTINEAGQETGSIRYSYLLSLVDDNTELLEVTDSEDAILRAWVEDKEEEISKVLETFPEDMNMIASDSFEIISFSPDETKVLYQARKDTTLPRVIEPPVIGANPSPEDRELEQNQLYVYDKIEDKNFAIPFDENKLPPVPDPISQTVPVPTDTEGEQQIVDTRILTRPLEISSYIQWYPSSRHLVYNQGDDIAIIEYDGLNKQTVYSGPYENEFFSTSSDWKLFILANLNPQNNVYSDLYEVGIR
jgi:hypothetical protein